MAPGSGADYLSRRARRFRVEKTTMTRRTFLALALALALPAGSALAAEPYKEATLDQVEAWVKAKSAVIYDVNGDDLWEKHHVPGAIHLQGKDWKAGLPKDKGALLVFYCSNRR